jgi:hypothetical protein
VRVREQEVGVFPALAAAGAFFAFEEGGAAVEAVAADGFAAFVDCVCLGRSSALLGWRIRYGDFVIEGDVEGYCCC